MQGPTLYGSSTAASSHATAQPNSATRSHTATPDRRLLRQRHATLLRTLLHLLVMLVASFFSCLNSLRRTNSCVIFRALLRRHELTAVDLLLLLCLNPFLGLQGVSCKCVPGRQCQHSLNMLCLSIPWLAVQFSIYPKNIAIRLTEFCEFRVVYFLFRQSGYARYFR